MEDDGLITRDITPGVEDFPHLGVAGRPSWLSRCWTGFRPVLAFPMRLLTAVLANGTILVCGCVAIIIGALFFLAVLGVIVAALLLCVVAICLFGITFGTTRIGDWISGNKTLAFLPKVLRKAADKVNVTEDIGNLRARANTRRNRGG